MIHIYLINLIAVGLFGMVLSTAFCDIRWTRRKALIMAGCMAVIFVFQGIIYFWIDSDIIEVLYPFVTHFPLAVVLAVLSRKWLWSSVSVLSAYLCCQTRRWIALLITAVFSGGSVMQSTAELVLTLPILLFLLWVIAPPMRSLSHYPKSAQLQFGMAPALYYGFDYLTRIYTDLLLEGFLVVVEFMPFVCSVAYILFAVHVSEEGRVRSQLEQTREILNLQVTQAIREIEILRESQKKTRSYHHDLRHHLQYLSSCIENGQCERAQEYIHEICSEIETNRVVTFCENEAANLIFSAFAKRADKCGIPIRINAGISKGVSMAESDLCVLISNAMENALHACQRLKEKGLQGEIEVSAYEKRGKLYFQFINSCDEDVTFTEGIPVTANPGHGAGVRSICAIVERYEGICSFSVDENSFILRAAL